MMVEQEEHLGRIMLSCISWVCAGALSGLYLLPFTFSMFLRPLQSQQNYFWVWYKIQAILIKNLILLVKNLIFLVENSIYFSSISHNSKESERIHPTGPETILGQQWIGDTRQLKCLEETRHQVTRDTPPHGR